MTFMTYQHTVHYYETDRMGITHHSNYIRWMEEARIDFLSRIGWDYATLELNGISSPVLSLSCKYSVSTTFADTIRIDVIVKQFNGIKLTLGYRMTNTDNQVVCEGTSEHCFLNTQGKPIQLKRVHPEFAQALSDRIETQ